MKNPGASSWVSSLEKKFIVLAGPPEFVFFSLTGENLDYILKVVK
jgi:hypothetical protein